MSLSLGEIRRKAMPFECLECPLKVRMMRPERGVGRVMGGFVVRNWEFALS